MNPHEKSGHGEPATREMPLLVSVPEAARLLGIGRTCAWDMVRNGELPIRRFRKRVLVPRVALEQLANMDVQDVEHDGQDNKGGLNKTYPIA